MEINDVIQVFSELGKMRDEDIQRHYPHLYAELERVGAVNNLGLHGLATRIYVMLVHLNQESDSGVRLDARTLIA